MINSPSFPEFSQESFNRMNKFYNFNCRRLFQSERWSRFHGSEPRELLGEVSAGGVPESGPYAGEDVAHDSNMLMILTVLLCAVICVLGLGSMVRCARRCRERMGAESAEHVAVPPASRGLKRKEMNALPATVYDSGSQLPEMGGECPICLAEFVEGETVRVLPKCHHGFHVECIDTWLRSRSSCPSCRHSLLDVEKRKPRSTLSCAILQRGETRGSGRTQIRRQPSVGEIVVSIQMLKAGDSNQGIPNGTAAQIVSSPPASSVDSGNGAGDTESCINRQLPFNNQ